MNELDKSKLVDEDTVLPAVPLWWHVLEDERAQSEIDHLGGGHVATDWGARIISDESRLYDPLSYHSGSVWPLFTGWASMGAYSYGRPHVGLQALMSNVLLQRQGALGYVTELLSGDFDAPFGRSSHHQVWSEAMTVTPLLRGLLGVEVEDAGTALSFAPQLPADWRFVSLRNIAAGNSLLDIGLTRETGRTIINLRRRTRAKQQTGDARASDSTAKTLRVRLAPALPLDARVRGVRLNGRAAKFGVSREGDVQRVEVAFDVGEGAEVVILFEEGTDVYTTFEPPAPGARNESLRVLRSHAEPGALRLLLEGRGGRSYTLHLKTPFNAGNGEGFDATRVADDEYRLTVSFPSPTEGYVRRELIIPLKKR
jgi:hypothetical protein